MTATTTPDENKLHTLNRLLQQQASLEGYNTSYIKGVGVFKASEPKSKSPNLYEPLICLVTQREKHCHVGDATYNNTQTTSRYSTSAGE